MSPLLRITAVDRRCRRPCRPGCPFGVARVAGFSTPTMRPRVSQSLQVAVDAERGEEVAVRS